MGGQGCPAPWRPIWVRWPVDPSARQKREAHPEPLGTEVPVEPSLHSAQPPPPQPLQDSAHTYLDTPSSGVHWHGWSMSLITGQGWVWLPPPAPPPTTECGEECVPPKAPSSLPGDDWFSPGSEQLFTYFCKIGTAGPSHRASLSWVRLAWWGGNARASEFTQTSNAPAARWLCLSDPPASHLPGTTAPPPHRQELSWKSPAPREHRQGLRKVCPLPKRLLSP